MLCHDDETEYRMGFFKKYVVCLFDFVDGEWISEEPPEAFDTEAEAREYAKEISPTDRTNWKIMVTYMNQRRFGWGPGNTEKVQLMHCLKNEYGDPEFYYDSVSEYCLHYNDEITEIGDPLLLYEGV